MLLRHHFLEAASLVASLQGRNNATISLPYLTPVFCFLEVLNSKRNEEVSSRVTHWTLPPLLPLCRAANNATISIPSGVTIPRTKPQIPLTITQQLLTITGPATGTPSGNSSLSGAPLGASGGTPGAHLPLVDCGKGPCLDAVCRGGGQCQLSLRHLRVANGVAPSGGCLHTVGYSVQAR